MADKTKYLIIGNSAGGIGAAEAIREVDGTGTITIISDEAYPAYSRPLISEYLAEKCPLERMLYRRADFYETNAIDVRLSSRVGGIDVTGKSVSLDDGTVIEYQRLLLATGGSPIVPPVESGDSHGVFTFTTLDDAKAIDQALDRGATRAVVIGGGLIGISVTEALTKRGIAVTIVEMLGRVLNTILDEETSAMEAAALEAAGVEIVTGHTVARIVAGSVVLDDGSAINCDLVVVAIGVRPRVDLARDAGITVNRGVVVDRRMETSAPGIYACGDAAEAFDFVHGENRLTPVWPNAYLGGRIAGLNMAGVASEYPGGTALNSMKYFGVAITSAGLAVPPQKCGEDGGRESYRVVSEAKNGCLRKVILRNGRIVGMVFAGDIDRSGIVYHLMKDGIDVSDFAESLVADDFGLISLPEELWRQRLTARSGAVAPALGERPS